ncbi:MAG: TlpA family protein disulfide reductase [Chloroflexi bacterium]|nr:TlpA family protein disulfide reductase [Chloroflexota bacterium]
MSETVQANKQPEAKTGSIRWTTVLIGAVLVAFIAMLGWGLVDSTAPRPEAGELAPKFDMEFFSGYEWDGKTAATLEDMQGKIVVVNFWASWCVECRVESDLFEQTWQKYRDQDVVFVGIAYADVEPNSIEYMEEFGLTYPHAPDLGTSISADYEITGVPETFFIDETGEIVHVIIGPVSSSTMEDVLTQMLAN